jgi:hypothetical protein
MTARPAACGRVGDVPRIPFISPLPALARTAVAAGRAAEGFTAELTLAALDAALASRFVADVVAHALRNPGVERAVLSAVRAPVTELALADALDGPVMYTAALQVRELLEGELLSRVLDGPELERLVARTLESPGMERLVAGAVESPGMERLVSEAVDSPAAEGLAARIVQSRLLDETFMRLLESEQLWMLIEEIARSPAVTEAITQQSVGFADQVADEVRNRSSGADAWLERTAGRLRRRHRDDGGPSPAPAT